jgi:hypothetical protein
MSLPKAKNAMRRAIEELISRRLTDRDKNRIWTYFDSRCAYCDRVIDRASRHGHMDHLDCSAGGGGNHIRNRVLACKECNGNEKREGDWRRFLQSKCEDKASFRQRRDKIRQWQKQFELVPPLLLTREAEAAKLDLEQAIKDFEIKFVRFRALIR